jgi:hypothetical protein
MPQVHNPLSGDRLGEDGRPVTSISQDRWGQPKSAQSPTPGEHSEDHDLEAKLAAASARLALLRAEEALDRPVEADPGPRPRSRDFDDYESYEAARDEWYVRRSVANLDRRFAEKDAATARARRAVEIREVSQAAESALAQAYRQRRDRFVETHPDYAEVAESDALRVSDVMAALIAKHPSGPAVAYHLGQHRDEANRIAQLDPTSQAAEFGRLTALVGTEPAPARRANPAPAQPRDASGRYVGTGREESMEQYAARRTAEIIAARSPMLAARR